MDVTIVGGGIAGTATALALHHHGVAVSVLEASPADDRRGSWLTLAPNGLAGLAALGVLDEVRSVGVPSPLTVLRSGTGAELGTVRLGSPLDDGTPATSFRRADLAAALREAVLRRGIRVETGARVTAVDVEGGVTLDGGTRIGADLVVGADGIRSLVRRTIDPAAPSPRFVGLLNFGGSTSGAGLAAALPSGAWTMTFGRDAFFGALPTSRDEVVWFVNLPGAPVPRAERTATDDATWRARLVDAARADVGPMAELIRAGRLELVADATHDLVSVPRWHRGRLIAVGDAVHAPSPSSGQGASMAIEDGIALARSLREHDDIPEALTAFERARRRRVERIVKDGARSSSSKTARGLGRVLRDAMMPWVFRHVVTDRSQAWKYDHRERLEAG